MLEEPSCWTRSCKHFRGADQPDGTESTETVVCRAFPHGIPVTIARGQDPHDKPLPNQDNDIVYERGEMEYIKSLK